MKWFKRILALLSGGGFEDVSPTMRDLFNLPKEIRNDN